MTPTQLSEEPLVRRLVATLLTVPFLALVPLPAAHAATFCQNRVPTIESSGGTVTGTEGDDVILLTGPATISALGGDDLICAVGASTVDAGSGADSVLLDGTSTDPVAADLGAGRDRLVLGQFGTEPALTGDVQAGSGRDTLALAAGKRVDADLDGGNIKVRQPSVFTSLTIGGFEDVEATAPRVNVLGDERANIVLTYSCHAGVHAGAGDDRVEVTRLQATRQPPCPTGQHARYFGDAGDDGLFGWKYSDRLVGGPGHDIADGDRGRDDCKAEIERNC
jgi:hypothetical protein